MDVLSKLMRIPATYMVIVMPIALRPSLLLLAYLWACRPAVSAVAVGFFLLLRHRFIPTPDETATSKEEWYTELEDSGVFGTLIPLVIDMLFIWRFGPRIPYHPVQAWRDISESRPWSIHRVLVIAWSLLLLLLSILMWYPTYKHCQTTIEMHGPTIRQFAEFAWPRVIEFWEITLHGIVTAAKKIFIFSIVASCGAGVLITIGGYALKEDWLKEHGACISAEEHQTKTGDLRAVCGLQLLLTVLWKNDVIFRLQEETRMARARTTNELWLRGQAERRNEELQQEVDEVRARRAEDQVRQQSLALVHEHAIGDLKKDLRLRDEWIAALRAQVHGLGGIPTTGIVGGLEKIVDGLPVRRWTRTRKRKASEFDDEYGGIDFRLSKRRYIGPKTSPELVEEKETETRLEGLPTGVHEAGSPEHQDCLKHATIPEPQSVLCKDESEAQDPEDGEAVECYAVCENKDVNEESKIGMVRGEPEVTTTRAECLGVIMKGHPFDSS